MSDKGLERDRYNNRANNVKNNNTFSVNTLAAYLKVPYIFYQKMISNKVDSNCSVLEIGAGMGENTKCLLSTGANIYATDISEQSLRVLRKRFKVDKLNTKVVDMEKLSFKDETFDVVVSAGSLSYGDNSIVLNEIYRVLKYNGSFIAIDSLNDNPIYRLNRYIHYLKGERTLSVIKRTPNLQLLKKYGLKFGSSDVYFFGSVSYLMPLLSRLLGEKKAVKVSNSIDSIFSVKRSAFKFVLIAKKKR